MTNLGYSNEIYIIVVPGLFISLFYLSRHYFIIISHFSSTISLVFHCILGTFFISYHYFPSPISLVSHCLPSSISFLFHCLPSCISFLFPPLLSSISFWIHSHWSLLLSFLTSSQQPLLIHHFKKETTPTYVLPFSPSENATNSPIRTFLTGFSTGIFTH